MPSDSVALLLHGSLGATAVMRSTINKSAAGRQKRVRKTDQVPKACNFGVIGGLDALVVDSIKAGVPVMRLNMNADCDTASWRPHR